jgi:hypothetical protein
VREKTCLLKECGCERRRRGWGDKIAEKQKGKIISNKRIIRWER